MHAAMLTRPRVRALAVLAGAAALVSVLLAAGCWRICTGPQSQSHRAHKAHSRQGSVWASGGTSLRSRGQPIQVMSKIRMSSAVSSAWKLSRPYPEPKTVMR